MCCFYLLLIVVLLLDSVLVVFLWVGEFVDKMIYLYCVRQRGILLI